MGEGGCVQGGGRIGKEGTIGVPGGREGTEW